MHVSTILMKELSLVEQGGLKLLLDVIEKPEQLHARYYQGTST